MGRKRPRAGASADERARELRAAWEKRAAPYGRLIFWPIIVAGVIGVLMTRPDPWPVLFGFLIGSGIFGYAFLLEDVPDEVYRWQRGAEGERRTELRLRDLEAEGWVVVHDVRRGQGNWDHIAVGPPGVFVLDTKDRKGRLQVENAVPQLRIGDEIVRDQKVADWPRWLTAAAMGVRNEIETAEGERIWVQAVLVFWGDFPSQIIETDRVAFVQGDALVEWLRARPARLSRGKQALVATVVEDLAQRTAGSAASHS